jgi:hypothetical protein
MYEAEEREEEKEDQKKKRLRHFCKTRKYFFGHDTYTRLYKH